MKKTAQEIMEDVYEPVAHDCSTLSEDLLMAVKEKPSVSKIEECMFRFKDQELKELQAKYEAALHEIEDLKSALTIAKNSRNGNKSKYDRLKEAALDFINKVDTGRARSTDSYNKFKNALKSD